MIKISTKIEFSHHKSIAIKQKRAITLAIDKLAFEVLAQYQDTAPRDTGAMAASAFVLTSRKNGKEEAYEEADRLAREAGKKDASLSDEPDPATRSQQAFVIVGVSYGAAVEFGTSRKGPQSRMKPAMDKAEAKLPKVVAAILNQTYTTR